MLRRSWPRTLELAYWPTVQVVLWGFVTSFFMQHSSWVAQAAGVLISAVLLWDVFFRGNLGISIVFMEEMWARNLAQMFASPLRPARADRALAHHEPGPDADRRLPAALLALPLFGVSVFDLGLPLAAFFLNLLVFGWAVGLVVSALVLRLGLGAESLAWVAVFAIAPLSGVYYPIDVLPAWLQPAALCCRPHGCSRGCGRSSSTALSAAICSLRARRSTSVYGWLAGAFFLRVCRDRPLTRPVPAAGRVI